MINFPSTIPFKKSEDQEENENFSKEKIKQKYQWVIQKWFCNSSSLKNEKLKETRGEEGVSPLHIQKNLFSHFPQDWWDIIIFSPKKFESGDENVCLYYIGRLKIFKIIIILWYLIK